MSGELNLDDFEGHTPAPWVAHREGPDIVEIQHKGNRVIGSYTIEEWEIMQYVDFVHRADERLVLAAPLLLERLKAVTELAGHYERAAKRPGAQLHANNHVVATARELRRALKGLPL